MFQPATVLFVIDREVIPIHNLQANRINYNSYIQTIYIFTHTKKKKKKSLSRSHSIPVTKEKTVIYYLIILFYFNKYITFTEGSKYINIQTMY